MKYSLLASAFRHVGTRKYALNTISLYVEHFLRVVVGFLVSLWVVRYLGPERFGMLSYSVAYSAIFISFASLGLDAVVVRELHGENSHEGSVMGTVFFLKLAASTASLGLIILSALMIEESGPQFHLILIVGGTAIFTATSTIEYYFQSQAKGHHIAIAKSCALLFTAMMRIVLIQIEADLIYFALAMLFDAVTMSGFLFFSYRRAGGRVKRWRWDGKMAGIFLKSAFFLSLNSAMVLLFWNIDKLMLRYLVNDFETLGIYSAAARLYEVWAFIPFILCSAFLPAILSVKDRPEIYAHRLQSLADVLFIAAVALTTGGILLAHPLIQLTLGADFAPATSIFSVAMLGNVFVFLGVVGSRFLILENLEHLLFVRTLLGVACNILLNYVLIQRYGAVGAAIATVISSFVVTILADLISLRDTRMILLIKLKSVFGIIRIGKWLKV